MPRCRRCPVVGCVKPRWVVHWSVIRAFCCWMNRPTTSILKPLTYPGNYDQYLVEKEEALRVEELQNAEFDRKLAQEEVWIRQGIKARRTRNEGRVRALKAMRRERSERREVMGTAKMQVEEATRSGKIVFEMENVDYQVDGKQLASCRRTAVVFTSVRNWKSLISTSTAPNWIQTRR